MAQAAIDEEFQGIATLVGQQSGALDEFTVRRWMKSVEALRARGAISDSDAYRLRASGYVWLNDFERAVRDGGLAVQRLPADSPSRADTLVSFAAVLLGAGETAKAAASLLEALRSPHVRKAQCASVLVGALCDLGLTEEAASVAEEHLADEAIEAEPPSLNPAMAFAALGRRHRAVEQLARFVLRTSSEAQDQRRALDVLEPHREQLLLTLARKPSLIDAWRYVEAFEKAQRALGEAQAPEHSAPTDDEIPEWVRVLRGRAAREVLSESDS